MIAEECARELCHGMDASTGAASPDIQQLTRLVLVTCERLVCMMVEKVPAVGLPKRPLSSCLPC